MKKVKSYKKITGSSKKFKRKNSKERQEKQKMYWTPEWRKFRLRFLVKNTKCFCCSEKATVVDHRVPHKGDNELFQDELNFLPMCAFCHNRVNHFDKNDDIVAKMTWIKKMREERNLTFPIKVVKFS